MLLRIITSLRVSNVPVLSIFKRGSHFQSISTKKSIGVRFGQSAEYSVRSLPGTYLFKNSYEDIVLNNDNGVWVLRPVFRFHQSSCMVTQIHAVNSSN